MGEFCYIITNGKKKYIGYTNNLKRRIRQHNCIIKGGAKATHGYKWKYLCIFSNFKSKIEGLQAEWRLKHTSKSRDIKEKLKSFFNYVDKNKKVSKNGSILKKYIIVYINKDLLSYEFNSNIILSINISFTDIILDHIYKI